jgi:hypothetical protein
VFLDESDNSFSRSREYVAALTAILNDGYRRGGRAMICLPPNWQVGFLPVFAPKALAGIGRLPDTVASRSIAIRMKRKARSERVERWRRREVEATAEPIAISVASVAERNLERLIAARPAIPDDLGDRAADVWEPLLAIAELAGDSWIPPARAAAIELSAAEVGEESLGVQLLAAIQEAFEGRERITCGDLVEALNSNDDFPFAGWNDRTGISTRELGWKLRPYGIKAKTVRAGTERRNGYERAQFEDAWRRYVPLRAADNRDNRDDPLADSENRRWENRDDEIHVTLAENRDTAHERSVVTVVTVHDARLAATAGSERAETGEPTLDDALLDEELYAEHIAPYATEIPYGTTLDALDQGRSR